MPAESWLAGMMNTSAVCILLQAEVGRFLKQKKWQSWFAQV
jgi:hypothetical protein